MSDLTAMLARHLVDLDASIEHARRQQAWGEVIGLRDLRDATVALRSELLRLALPHEDMARRLLSEEVHPLV